MAYYSFMIEGKPLGKERPRFNSKTKTTYTPDKTKNYEKNVKLAYMQAGGKKLNGPITIAINAYFAKPKSSKEIIGSYSLKKPDIDNIVKIILDGLNGVAYDDDKQVVEVTAKKIVSSGNYVTVSIVSIFEDKEKEV